VHARARVCVCVKIVKILTKILTKQQNNYDNNKNKINKNKNNFVTEE